MMQDDTIEDHYMLNFQLQNKLRMEPQELQYQKRVLMEQ